MKTTKMLAILVLAVVVGQDSLSSAVPMDTAWTYQGRLIDANDAADGLYDFQFKLFNDPCTGTQQGSIIDVNDLDVIDGYFTVELDFGSNVFDGNARWLEVGVRAGDSNDPNSFVSLSPRQEITPVPYALHTRGIFVDNSGNVGIGTTSPSALLDVAGKAEFLDDVTLREKYRISTRAVGDTTDYLQIERDWGGWREGIYMHRQSGNVGIGTTSPGAKLDVAGNIGVSGTIDGVDLSVHAANANAHHTPPTTLPPSGPAGGDLSGTYPSPSVVNDSHTHGDGTVSDNISINNTRLYAPAGSGNVGIGTTSPTQKLDVVGNITASKYYDRNYSEYYVEPGYYSKLYRMDVSRLNATEINVSHYVDTDDLYVEYYIRAPIVYETSVFGRSVYVSENGTFGYLISSRRYKENITPLEDDVTKILEAEPVSFICKESKERSIGLIAEDLDDLGLLDLVIYDSEHRPESVRYEFVSLYLLEVLKDQANSIKELKAENESLKKLLKAENQSVKQRLSALEKTIQQLANAREVQL